MGCINGLVQERCNSSALAMELRLSNTNPSICEWPDSQIIANEHNYINPGYGLSLVDNLWNASSYRQPLEQEGNPMT